uniref:myomegalin-like isoform X2 n=1 Tax=Macaca mulatta TaxID=9544 RepID=UPI0010A29E38|nr:myomegalin-like isoform X2 [Macaca mulatta]
MSTGRSGQAPTPLHPTSQKTQRDAEMEMGEWKPLSIKDLRPGTDLSSSSCNMVHLQFSHFPKDPSLGLELGFRWPGDDDHPFADVWAFCRGDLDAGSSESHQLFDVCPLLPDDGAHSLGDLDTVAGLEKELSNAKAELELMAKKERESQMELSALQSMMAVQEEELQVQAADMESLTRNIQIKEDLIKDLQMQLVDPEDIPAMERLTQEVLLLREKVASVESQGQEISGNRRQQLLLMLEGLVDERSWLNEALQAERQLYSSLVKFHAHPESSERDRTLQVELEGAQVLRSRLEEVLGRSLERLNRLETLAAIGGAAAGDDTEDASTEFTDSIEEEATHHSHQQREPYAT